MKYREVQEECKKGWLERGEKDKEDGQDKENDTYKDNDNDEDKDKDIVGGKVGRIYWMS